MSQSSMFGKPSIALNAIHSISVYGLATSNEGTPRKLEIKRIAPESSKKLLCPLFFDGVPDNTVIPEIPPPTQSRLPPNGNVILELHVGDILSQNDRNIVYAVRVTNADNVACYVPPLVMKVARLFKGRNVSEEAGMYQDLECLQGSILPRCYGYFCTTIDHTQVAILPWDGPDCGYPRALDPYIPFHPAVPLSMMLLERPGDPIPTGSGKEPENMRRDMLDLHDELSRFGVYKIDWGLRNFLLAPPSPPGLPGTPSPNHDHLYSIRLFDFEFCVRTNIAPHLLNQGAAVHMRNLLDEITYHPSSRQFHLASVRWK